MEHTTVSKKLYYLVFLGLIVLTAVTVQVSFIDLGPLNTIVALSIALTKALLVILYFMHVRYSNNLIKAIVIASAFWLLLLLGLTMTDFAARDWFAVPQGW